MTVIHRKPRRFRRSVVALERCEARVLMATAPPLGLAASFAVLGGATVTNTGTSTIVGNVGVSPGTSITGFPPGVVSGGAIHAGDALATTAEADLATAYGDLSAEPVDTILSGDLGGKALTPGFYHYTGAAVLSGTLTLDAQGNPNAVFVIQTVTALTTASNSSVVLVGGAHARNVFWQVGSSATIGSGTNFQGSILAFTSITLVSGSNIAPGRALAINGAVTMDTNSASTVFTTSLTITPNEQSQVYGGTQPTLTASYTGFINGDTPASLTTPPILATAPANSHVGTYAITASGAVDPDYIITYGAGTLSVTQAALTITANDESKVFRAALPRLDATYVGFVNGDTAASLTTPPTLATTAIASSPIGTYPITDNGAVDSDYTITSVPGTLTIGSAPLIITTDSQSKSYGAALPTLTVSYTGFVNGDTSADLTTQPTTSTTALDTSGVAGNPYPISASGATDSNYVISYVFGSLTVTPVALTITANDQSKLYGTALPEFTVSYNGFVNGDTFASLTPQPTLTTLATASSSVGTYAINSIGAADPNYTITSVPGTLTVGSVPLLITANSQNKAYGAALPTLTASYTGFVNGDTSASLTTLPILATAPASSSVGTYSITASGAVDGNYVISYAPGSLAVTPVVLTITADNQSKVIGAALPALTAIYTGFVNGDTSASLTPLPTLSTTASAASPIGSYPITASGAADPNYSISYAPGTLAVTSTTNTGTVYLDDNANGVLDAREPGLSGRIVYLDLNHDGTLDAGDPSATTDANGNYTVTNSTTGTGPMLEATTLDATNRYVVDQTATSPNGQVTIGDVPISPIAPVKVIPNPFSTNPNADPNTAYVNSLYHAVLGRTGDSSEVGTWLVKMSNGMTPQQVAAGFVNSLEHRQDQVNSYYQDFLQRAPDPASVVWVNDLMAGTSEENVVKGFLYSAEYQASHQDSTLFIDDLYLDILGRNGESTGVAGWMSALTGGASRQSVVNRFVDSVEADDQLVQSFYTAFLRRQREGGTTSEIWDNMLEAQDGSATNVVVGILASSEFDQDALTPKS